MAAQEQSTPSGSAPSPRNADAARWFAMKLSLFVGFGMLAGKVTAYVLTGSAAILSDAAESVIHVIAVAFAAFSLRLSQRPADARFPYGYERIAFFSAGFEGALIILAAVTIIAAVVDKWIRGLQLEQLGLGTALVAAAAALNAALGSTSSARGAGPGHSSWKRTASTSSPTAGPASGSSVDSSS